MQLLCINNASQDGFIGLYSQSACISSIKITNRMEEGDCTNAIETVLQESGSAYKNITHLACINGPGGFTSLRVSVTAINVLQVLLKKPVTAVHLADLYKARLTRGSSGVWLHSTKRDLVFIQGIGDYESFWPKPTLLSFKDCQTQLPEGVQWCGELIADHTDQLQSKLANIFPLAPINTVLPALLAAQKYSLEPILPWYGREG